MPLPRAGFEIHGIKNVMRKLEQATVKVDQLAKMAVQTACILVDKEVRTSFSTGKGLGHADYATRRQYKRQKGKRGKWHVASAPGQPPAVDTGRLRASMTWNIENRQKSHPYTFTGGAGVTKVPATKTKFLRIVGLVGTNVEYAPRLEFGFKGTDSKGRQYNQEPRPFLFPAVKRKQKEISLLFRETLKKL